MNVKYLFSLLTVVVLGLLVFILSNAGLQWLFGLVVPLAAVLCFLGGVIYKILNWAKSPVPFRIPTTAGQQKSLPWIKDAKLDNPSTTLGVVIRMALEILCFRSLFRNTRAEIRGNDKLSYEWEKWLWLAALAFHYSFLVVLLRHMRFFFEPIPAVIQLLEFFDGFVRIEFMSPFLKVGLPGFYLSGLVLLAAVIFLFLRRVVIPQVRYISLAADYFPLFLIMGIALTGILMRYFAKVDIVTIKSFTLGLVNFHWSIPEGISGLFFVHLFYVSLLFAYFPFSKLMHAGGVFLSPTRNLANTSRAKRHVNPWNYPVKVHSYEAYENDFREKMIEAGLPVDKKE